MSGACWTALPRLSVNPSHPAAVLRHLTSGFFGASHHVSVCSSEVLEKRGSVRGLLLGPAAVRGLPLGPELLKHINKSLCDSLLFDIAEHAESSKYVPRVGTKEMAVRRLSVGHSRVPRDGYESRQEGFSESHSSDNMTKRFL